MSLLTNFQDLASAIKIALSRKADKSELASLNSSLAGTTAELREWEDAVIIPFTTGTQNGDSYPVYFSSADDETRLRNLIAKNRKVYLQAPSNTSLFSESVSNRLFTFTSNHNGDLYFVDLSDTLQNELKMLAVVIRDGTSNYITYRSAHNWDINSIKNGLELATVASTGAYSDLSGTPTLATVAGTGAYSDLSGTPTLGAVATSNSYNDLDNLPTLKDDQFYFFEFEMTNDTTCVLKNGLTNIAAFSDIKDAIVAGKKLQAFTHVGSSSRANSTHVDTSFSYDGTLSNMSKLYLQFRWAREISGVERFLIVNGSYDFSEHTESWTTTYFDIPDISGKENTSNKTQTIDGSSTTSQYPSAQAVYNKLQLKQDAASLAAVATSGAYSDLSGTPTLATVATSGSYEDLNSKPTIPQAGTIASGSTGYATGGDVYSALQNVSGWVAQDSTPSDTSLLWIDTDDNTVETYIDADTESFPMEVS